MYKYTVIFYPHIVKQYQSIEQFIEDNGYATYYDEKTSNLTAMGIDMSDATVYQTGLSEDGFEAKSTIAFDSEAAKNAAFEAVGERDYADIKTPIFEEEFEGTSTEHLF